MSKEKNGIKGWELLKMISEGKIKDGDMFDVILPLTKAVACKAIRVFFVILKRGCDFDEDRFRKDIIRPESA